MKYTGYFVGFVVFVMALMAAAGAWVTYSHFEAETYNRLTGSSVSTYDAMWVKLVVKKDRESK